MDEDKCSGGGSQMSFSKDVFFNLSIFQFLTYLRRGVFYSFMIDYLYVLMQTVTYTAALGTLNMVGSSLGQNLLWGRICDRYKLRAKLIIVGESVAGFGYLIVFLVHSFLISSGNSFDAGLSLIFGLSFLEFFWSMSDVGWAALLTDVTTSEVRGRIIGVLNFIASFGRMIGILFAGFLYNGGEGFRDGTIFYVVTVLLFIGVSIMIFMSRLVKRKNAVPKQVAFKETELHSEPSGHGNEKVFKWFLLSLIVIVLGAASVNQIFLLFMRLPNGLNATDPERSLILSSWTIGGMIASLVFGRLADKIGRIRVLFLGLGLAMITPLLYGVALNVSLMALIYGLNGVSFWTIQTVGFVFAGDMIPEHRRGRLLSRYNMVIALSWGPAGILIGGPFADAQVSNFGFSAFAAYVNAFYVASAIVLLGTVLFAIKVARSKVEDTV